MGVRLVVAICLVLGALWDFFTTFYGVSYYFDLPMNPNINPAQFIFALVVTMVVFGFVIATHLIWDSKQDDTPALILKAALVTCIAIDLVTAWEGTKRFVFYGDEGDAARGAGLAIVTALIVSSTIFLPKLIGMTASQPSLKPGPSKKRSELSMKVYGIMRKKSKE
jgi:tryptophan-rich sensory protein